MRALGYDKVFCIGEPKTGTQSLAAALRFLGFRHKGWDRDLWDEFERGDHAAVYEAADRFESFDSGPWGALYKELDRRYPGSKFVLSIRDRESWSRSHERHFAADGEGQRQIRPNFWIADYAAKRDEIVRRYEEKNADVIAHFADRPASLLVMDVCGGDGWERLCPFLGLRVPSRPFPHANPTSPQPAATHRHR
jgi:Sulfotransferase domain